jgi:hypothetical protein
MSAVSNKVTPASSAASIRARAAPTSLPPNLHMPQAIGLTVIPLLPSGRDSGDGR